MCDYSLHGIKNRLATEGDQLVVHRFGTGSMGMAAQMDLRPADTASRRPWNWLSGNSPLVADCAVCIPPGAKLLLKDIPLRIQRDLGVRGTEEVVFTQVTANPNTYRDAVRFSNGTELLLQRLERGQRVEVLSLSVSEVETPSVEDWAGFTT
jgi:hypothetical protein